jgi:hypothetical protein
MRFPASSRHRRVLLVLLLLLALGGGLLAARNVYTYGITDCQTVRKMLEFNKNSSDAFAASTDQSLDGLNTDSEIDAFNTEQWRNVDAWTEKLDRYAEHIDDPELRGLAVDMARSARTVYGYLRGAEGSLDTKPEWWDDMQNAYKKFVESGYLLASHCP